MKNTIANNLMQWDRIHDWSKDGDEWDGQARSCRQPYDAWKKSLVDTFLIPNISSHSVVLEIAPGHGRWSREMIGRCKELILVDLSPSCIAYCQHLFGSPDHVRYITNDGKLLNGVADDHVDFVWSYDSFVHMDEDTIDSYLGEIHRVLRSEGTAVIHHAGRTHGLLWLRWLRHCGRIGRELYNMLSMRRLTGVDGWRSDMSKQLFRKLATAHMLVSEAQVQSWGENREFGIPRFGDYLSILRKQSFSRSTSSPSRGQNDEDDPSSRGVQ